MEETYPPKYDELTNLDAQLLEENDEKGAATATPVHKDVASELGIRLYFRRWVILAIFMVYAIAAGMQWMQYTIINNIVQKYYRVDDSQVEYTTLLHMIAYIVCIIPALWILEKAGNRTTMLLAGTGITIGIWIKLWAVQPGPNAFTYVLVGQAIEASAQVLTFGLAGSVTAAWFGRKEIALAGSMAMFGDQLGAGLGFYLPPLFVNKRDTIEHIGEGLYNLALFITVLTTSIYIIMLLFFKDSPKTPPSKAQIARNEVKSANNTVDDFIKMVSRRSFLMLLLTYGMHIGVFNAHATIMNPVFMTYFPGKETDCGLIGCLIILFGLLGSIIAGIFLDWTHYFKGTTCALFFGSTICMTGYTFALQSQNLIAVYMLACTMGLFMFGYYSVALQYAIELVHPYSEASAAGLSLLSAQIFGLCLTPIYRYIIHGWNPLTANFFLISLLLLGAILSLSIPPKYRRQTSEKSGTNKEDTKQIVKNVI